VSRGLLLMILHMGENASELPPALIHVAARSIVTPAPSIGGDHSEVYTFGHQVFPDQAAWLEAAVDPPMLGSLHCGVRGHGTRHARLIAGPGGDAAHQLLLSALRAHDAARRACCCR
jgi:hypothetical protein